MKEPITNTAWHNQYCNEVVHYFDDSNMLCSMIDMKKVILKARKNKKKVIFAGNGTSSLTATRGAMGLITQLGIECTAITDPSFITAAANDFGYEDVFTRYVNLFAHKGDVVVLISASGKSKNICDVSVVAHQKGCTVITFSGFNINNPLKKSGDINFWTSCNEYSKVESIHNVWMGMICDFILKDEKHKVGIHGIEF